MQTTLKIAILLLFLTVTIAVSAVPDDNEKLSIRNAGKQIHELEKCCSLDLKGELRKQFAYLSVLNGSISNVVSSPISALLPLGTLALGSEGQTFSELARAIGVKTQNEVQDHFKKLLKDIGSLTGVTLDIASRIYLNVGKQLKKPFKSTDATVFNSSVNFVDFSRNYEAVQQINRWVAANTHSKIQKLLSPNSISKGTSIILVNAVYFMGKWVYPFKSVLLGNFYAPRGQKEVSMLINTAYYKYYKSSSLDAQMILIPYKENRAGMLLVLPSQIKGLSTLINKLKRTPELLQREIEKMKRENVRVTIPKFHIETELDLMGFYEKIGLQQIFSPGSGLNEMVVDEKLRVSAAIQKAYIDVNQWGTEAAAATGMQLTRLSLNLNTKRFVADRPFLFFVMAESQQLFSGTVVDP